MTEGEGQSHWWRISATVALDAADRVSIVVYAGASGVVLEPTPADQSVKKK